ncbi:MAG: hypothetical protein EBY52_00740 [Actinobacteria bacterium]|nr:hypothetical protein [Actinomycetota bacterium]
MTVDHRCRLHVDEVALDADQALDEMVPALLADHGPLAARGVRFKKLPALGLRVGDRAVTLMAEGDTLSIVDGVDRAGIVAELEADALSDLLQDRQSTMGLAMTSRVQITDDPEELAHFLAEAGFLHLHGVFDPSEMAAIEADIDQSIAAARDADPEYWWCTDADGKQVAVRSLNFQEKSAAVRATLADERLTRLADLTGDGHRAPTKCEGLVKPLDIVAGLSDLPWHKDCGQGLHSYMCNSLTVGISVTGADRVSGALGVVAGSHRANTTASVRDKQLDLPAKLLETTTGDLTIHCSDTLHRAYPPSAHPRKVVYTSFTLPPLPGDEVAANPRYSREARSELTDVQERIAASDNPDAGNRYVPHNG